MLKNSKSHITVSVDAAIARDAERVFESLGISTDEAISIYFRQVALKKGIPFDLTTCTEPDKNYERVSDLKQDDLKKVLDAMPESVDELWVFGSAVTCYCRPDSDLDVCAVGDNITREDRRKMIHAPRRALDLLTISHEDFERESRDHNSVFHAVKNDGLLIYRKGEGLV